MHFYPIISDIFCFLILFTNQIHCLFGACGYCCTIVGHTDLLWIVLIEYQFKWMNSMESSVAKIRMVIHTPTQICVLLFALRHNLINRPVASVWKMCNSKNIEAVKYSVEGQASHTDERYLFYLLIYRLKPHFSS